MAPADHQYHLTDSGGRRFVFCSACCLLMFAVYGLPADLETAGVGTQVHSTTRARARRHERPRATRAGRRHRAPSLRPGHRLAHVHRLRGDRPDAAGLRSADDCGPTLPHADPDGPGLFGLLVAR
jgi:hypothetical protein